MRIIAIFLGLFMLAGMVGAETLSIAKIRDHLQDDGSIVESLDFRITNNTQNEFFFSLPPKAGSITVNGNPSEQKANLTIPLRCSACDVALSYAVPDVIKNEGSGIYTFSRTINFPKTPQKLEYTLLLPPGYVIDDFSSEEPAIVPTPTQLTSDGEHIEVVWMSDNPALPQRYFVRISDHESTETSKQEIGNEFAEWPVWVIGATLLLAGVAIGMALSKKARKGVEMVHVPSSLLSADERTILKTIKESENPLTQKEVGKVLGWSKSKVSALMTALERKQIIAREKIGRNYKIEVKKEVDT